MKRAKKALALLLAVIMCITSGLTVLAAEESAVAETTGNSSINGQNTVESQTLETETDESVEQNIEGNDNTSVQSDQQVVQSEEQSINQETVTDTEKQRAFEYVYMDEQTVNIPDEQNIVIAFADTSIVLESAVLHYSMPESGTLYDLSASNIVANTVLFKTAYTDVSQVGNYKLDSITYRISGHAEDINVSFSEQDVLAEYTVTTEPETKEQSEPPAENQEEVPEVTVYSLDDSGNVVEQGGETENIESTVESVLSVADAEGTSEGAENDARLADVPAMVSAEAATSESRAANKVVVICAGHDATHTGARGNGLKEEELTWKVAQYCKAELEQYYGVTVYLDRSSVNCAYPGRDMSYCLNQRVYDAHAKGASVFVDIHFNSVNGVSTAANGSEVYYPNNSYSTAIHQDGANLANNILAQLEALGLTNRGAQVKNATTEGGYRPEYDDQGRIEDYYTTNNLSKSLGMTGIIVEHAFLDNAGDAAKLKNESFLKQLGVADAKGIANTYGLSKMDYSPVYDYDYYINHYADLKTAFGNDKTAAFNHFITNGMQEGRQASAEFNVWVYKDNYADLRKAFGNDLKAYYEHYLTIGKAEGRTAVKKDDSDNGADTKPTQTKGTTVYKGVDYAAVYDFQYYITKYADLKKVFQYDDAGALEHFVETGMREGRQAKDSFDVNSYRNQYADLRKAFGSNLKLYYEHYINTGKKEGRKATGVTELQNATTVYKGVDYAVVYDFNYYIAKYDDLKKVFRYDEEGALAHFVENGMGEGRQAKDSFDVKSYRNQYADLRKAFGSNLKLYYEHYINTGKKEGRKATGVTELQNATTIYKGVDYAAVYDFNYYIAKYDDLKKVFRYDEEGALAHFVENGMGEGRQAKDSFNVRIYKNNYRDLQNAFGNNNKLYYLHYINIGKSEGRTAVEEIAEPLNSIMGTTSTTVEQMVRYFNSKATYPTAELEKGGASDIRTFCQIYVEEAKKEGVRAEVAFAQAMKETRFLKFGGIVKTEQFNFAGLGAVDDNETGKCASFVDVRTGIRAQVQHLKAYATTEALNQICVDPRFKYVKRGTAAYVEWLGINENPNNVGWATEKDYGYSIINSYMKVLLES